MLKIAKNSPTRLDLRSLSHLSLYAADHPPTSVSRLHSCRGVVGFFPWLESQYLLVCDLLSAPVVT
jgi:hypothetical protein